MFMYFKKRYLAGAIAVGVLIIFFLVSHPSPVVAGGVGCRAATGQTSSGTAESVYASQGLTAKTAITGSYNLSFSCDSGASAGNCSAATNAANTAMGQGNSINGFPQGDTDGSSNNNITVEVGNNSMVCSVRPDGSIPGACGISAGGTGTGNSSIIYINAASTQGASALQNSNALLSILEHEMSHSFGVADTYQYIPQSSDSGLMSNGTNLGATWATDPLLQSVIKSINSGSVSCLSTTCPPGFVSAITTANVNPVPACKPSTSPPITSSPPPPLPTCTAAQIAAGASIYPSAFDCILPPGTTYCSQNPTSPYCPPSQSSPSSCQPGYVLDASGNCEMSTSTTQTGSVSCACSGANVVCTYGDGTVTTNPDATCAAQQQQCNPDDPVASPDCPAASSTDPTATSTDPTDYCAQNPTDPDCESYCAQNPDDASCTGNNSTGDNGGDNSGDDGGGGRSDCYMTTEYDSFTVALVCSDTQ